MAYLDEYKADHDRGHPTVPRTPEQCPWCRIEELATKYSLLTRHIAPSMLYESLEIERELPTHEVRMDARVDKIISEALNTQERDEQIRNDPALAHEPSEADEWRDFDEHC